MNIMHMDEPKEQKGEVTLPTKPSRLWISMLVIVCLAFIANGARPSSVPVTTNPIYWLIENLPASLVVWVVFHPRGWGQRGKKAALLAFIAIVASFMARDFIQHSLQKDSVVQSANGKPH